MKILRWIHCPWGIGFVCGLLALFLHGFFSIELIDEGSFISTQSAMLKWGVFNYVDIIWLTNAVGAFWLYWVQDYGLIFVRLGGAILIFINSFVIFKFLWNLNLRQHLFLATFVGSLCIILTGSIVINYETLPLLVLNLFVLSYHHCLFAERKSLLKNILCGLLLWAVVQMRYSCVLALSLVVIGGIYELASNRKIGEFNSVWIFVFFIGWNLAFLGWLALSGNFNLFFSSFMKFWAVVKDTKRTWVFWDTLIFFQGKWLFLFFVTGIITLYFGSLKSKFFSKWTQFLLIATGICGVSYFYIYQIPSLPIIIPAIGWLLSLMTFEVFILFKNALASKSNRTIKILILFTFAILSSFVIGYGSGTGAVKFMLGGTLLIPLVVSIKPEFEMLLKEKRWFDLHGFRFSFWMLLICVVVFRLIARFGTTFGDERNIFKLTTPLEMPRGRGVYTSHSRAEILNQVTKEIAKYVLRDDVILVYGMNSYLYFLTGTHPPKEIPVEINFSTSHNELEKIIPKLCSNLSIKLYVKTKHPLLHSFSDKILTPWDPYHLKTIHLIEDGLKSCPPQKIWENKYFAIYKPMPNFTK